MLGAHRRPVEFAGWGAFVVDGATPAAGGPPGPGSISAARAGQTSAAEVPYVGLNVIPGLHVPPGKALACALNQGSAGSSPHHISGTIEAILASTSQFPAGVYQNRLGYQNSSAAVGCSAPRSRIFVGISIVATLPKSLAHKRITHW